MANQEEGHRISPVLFEDAGDGTVAERIALTGDLAAALLGALATSIAPMVGDGRAVVENAGVSVPLAAVATPASWVQVTASRDNAGEVVVGTLTVVADLATRRGTPLAPGETMTVGTTDLALVRIDAEQDDDAVTFTYGGP